MSDLEKLEPGQAMYWSFKAGSEDTVVTSVDEFYSTACKLFNG